MTGVDVTERIAGQERLQETEAFQRQILDRLPAIVWTTDRELRTTFSAGGGLTQLGLASGEVSLLGTPVTSLLPDRRPQSPRDRRSPPRAQGRIVSSGDALVRALLPFTHRAAQRSTTRTSPERSASPST